MNFKGIEKKEAGKFITRYDITYETVNNQKKVYEIISRKKDMETYEALHGDKPDAVVIIATNVETSCFDKRVVKNINTKEEYVRLVLPVVFCVSGVKDSGKTGLIVKLINEFITQDYTVAVIKHDGHEYEMDHEGTDTWCFTRAGAKCSAIFSDTQ